MELGLSLGEAASKPFGFMGKTLQVSNKLGFGFCTTLSIGPFNTRETQESKKDKHKQEHAHDEDEENTCTNDYHRLLSLSPKTNPPLRFDLLPHTPIVPHNPPSPHLSFPWPPLSQNGNSVEAGSSKGLDVNRLPVAGEDEGEEGTALSSSPNSAVASSFQMDLCIYRREGNFSVSGKSGKRDSSEGETYYDHQRGSSSRASDEDDNCGSTRKKLRLSKEQSSFLEESFKQQSNLNPKRKIALAKQLNLSTRQVEVWFQNRRARTKLKQTEVDCEYFRRCCETLKEENTRLHKELQDLRALKTSSPFQVQLPATTITMCPSCERVVTNPAAASGPVATVRTGDSTNRTIGLPLHRPRFYPFPHAHQPMAS